MNETPEDPRTSSGGPPRRFGGRLALARLALLWERVWPATWPVAGVCGVFLGLALIDILPALPGWLHGLVLLGLLTAVLVLGWRGLRDLRAPDAEQARRRLELDSGLDHRPLTALDDTLVAGAADGGSAGLWALHQQRLRARLAGLRVG